MGQLSKFNTENEDLSLSSSNPSGTSSTSRFGIISRALGCSILQYQFGCVILKMVGPKKEEF